ncbi:MAG: penicillin-binding protein 2, partial [Actinomycetota bacterium]|nr:penicillin-binding protein 2 [Actinomycetota bacterium]
PRGMLRSPVDVGRLRGPGKKNGKKKEAEPSITRAKMQVRVVGLAALVSVLFLVLAFRLWYLQVLTGEEYTNTAQATQTRSTKIPAQRGVIYDRNGEVLANNVPGLNVTIVPNSIPREKVEELADVLNADKKAILSRYDAAIESGNQYSPMLVKENASREDVVYVSERTEEYEGLVVNDDYVRNYPNGELAAHILGYTGAINEQELETDTFEGFDHDAVVGKSGVELAYEEILRGEPGKREYNVDALGRQVALRRADGQRYDERPEGVPELGRPARITEPVPGKDLKLTIDLNLQETVEKELDAAIVRAREEGGGAGTGGAVIALDPRNGEIRAMASQPTFDPQMFVGGITGNETQRYEYLTSEGARGPFTNRAIYGAYPGASTFKPFTGLAGLQQGAISPSTTVTDTGSCWRPAGATSGCWQSWRENSPKYQFLGPHGTQSYAQAIGDSNNKFFFQVADWMWNRTDDPNLLPKFYRQFGFGEKTGVDLPGEGVGRVPTREWQEETGDTTDDKLWTVGRWVNMAIGQGDLLVTPIQLLRGYAAIANGGTLITPHVGMDAQDQNGRLVEKIDPKPAGEMGVDPYYIQETIRGLKMVTAPGGTAENAFTGSPLSVAGKTGTGEMWGKDPINYFVGWAENQGDPLVVLVMVEEGGAFEHGSEVTVAPAARNILEAYHGANKSSNEDSAD